MKSMCTFTSITNAAKLVEFVGKTVTVRTKQQHSSKGVVHTVDPVTKRYGYIQTVVMPVYRHNS